jgi:hypothetical protein
MADETWEQRVRPGAYTPPLSRDSAANTGRITFQFEDVSRETELRTSVFSFAGVNNDYVQQNGFGSRRYPLRCYFTGPQCDRLATVFEQALCQPGIGKLEHPMYGTIDVVPVGTITRNDALKTAANQSVVDVTFWTTTGSAYPSSASDAQNEILAAIADFDVATAQQFASSVAISRAVHKASLTSGIRKMLSGISDTLSGVSSAVSSVNKQFRELQSTVNYGMDVLIGQPLLLAQQVSNLIKAPARAWGGIESRMAAYGAFEQRIFGSDEGNPARQLLGVTTSKLQQATIANNFHASVLAAMNAVAGSVIACSANPVNDNSTPLTRGAGFTTRPQAVAAADVLSSQFDALIAWMDEGFGALATLDGVQPYQIDTGEAYQALHNGTCSPRPVVTS